MLRPSHSPWVLILEPFCPQIPCSQENAPSRGEGGLSSGSAPAEPFPLQGPGLAQRLREQLKPPRTRMPDPGKTHWTEGRVANCARWPRGRCRWPVRGMWGRREPERQHLYFRHCALPTSCSSPTFGVDCGPVTFRCPLDSVLSFCL